MGSDAPSAETLEAAFARGEPAALAVARARAYTLFSSWIRRGLVAESLPHAEALPELAEALEPWRRSREGWDLEAAAAAHQRVLGHEVFPVASAFLDPAGRAGGEVTRSLQDLLQDTGVPWDPTDEGPDHLAVLLDGLAFLSAAEAEAHRDGRGSTADAVRGQATRLLQRGLLSWWAPFSEAVRDEGEPFFARLMDLIEALLTDHWAGADTEREGEERSALASPLAQLLESPACGLADIAEHLTLPHGSGLFLSRRSIRDLARTLGVPVGFGTRSQRLETLLRSAAEVDRWPEGIGLLIGRVRSAEARMATPLAGETWIERLQQTRAGLESLRRVTLNT
ncbi:MAG: molecular chaperone TorD family protein [Myxococcota bacterium]